MTVKARAGAETRRTSSNLTSSWRCFTPRLVSAVALTAVVAVILSLKTFSLYSREAAQQEEQQQSTPRGLSRPSPRLETNNAESRMKGNAADEIDFETLAASKRNHEQRVNAGAGRYHERPDIIESHHHDPTSASYAQDSGVKMRADNSVGKDCPVAPEGAGDEVPTRGQTIDDENSWNTAASSSRDSAPWTAIPFFGSVDANNNAQISSAWSHLNHRVEEYREDLVKVVQSLDMIINTLESSAATESSVGGQDRDMPGEGMRQLAAKLRRKLEKTPPRWQVNTDVLSWLLRPVPFVTGLPSPSSSAPFAPAGAPEHDDNTSTSSHSKSNRNDNNNNGDEDNAIGSEREGKSCDDFQVIDLSTGDATGEGGEEEAVERRKEAPAGEARSSDAAAVKERRAAPVPIFEAARDGEDVGSGGTGKQGSKKRAGFHAYDETHQVFTHILRDWTSEGDTVRAGVYDPLLRALDEYVGWQEGAVPLVDHPIDLDGRSSADGSGEVTSIEGDGGGGGGGGDDVSGGERRTQKPGALGGQTEPPSGARFPYFVSKPSRARRRKANVLVPGAGLGRLAAEVAARGYASVHANELSTTMLSSCYWLMEALRDVELTGAQTSSPAPARPVDSRERGDGNHPSLSPAPAAHTMSERGGVGHPRSPSQKCGDSGDSGEARRCGSEAAKEEELGRGGDGDGRRAEEDHAATRGNFFKFYPFLNDPAHNEIDGEARFRSVLFPDPEGRDVLGRASGSLSFQAGEFSATYGGVGGPYEGTFDAVVTSFFVDTAPNVVQYVATIRRALTPGGVWINCGPLHWHDHSALALSLDEMLILVAGSGFRMKEAKQLAPSAYRVQDGAGSLRVEEFSPVFWVAVLEGGAQA